MSPARNTFYTAIDVYTSGEGKIVDGQWVEGADFAHQTIQGSFQPPAPLRQQIDGAGDYALGDRQMWTTVNIPFYDLDSAKQSWVWRENRWWRITERHQWDGWVSRGLFVYGLERYHRTTGQGFAPPPDPEEP
jgi:hypothetical protein